MIYVKAFVVGGLICALVQIFMEKTKMLPGRIMVFLVCLGVILSALGWYQPLVDFAGAGASVPLSGFGHMLWQGVKESIHTKGWIGIFEGGFSSCAIGLSSALIFSLLAAFVFQPKMKP